MTNARHRFTPSKGRRLPTVAALALGIIGALLITLAACSSRSGPPVPTAAAAGNITDSFAAVPDTSAAVPPVSAAGSTVPGSSSTSLAATATPRTKSGTKTANSSSPAKTKTAASSTSSPSASPPSKIPPPSFANSAKGLVLLPSTPVSLSVPAIDVKSALLSLGLNPDGTVQVPSLTDPDSKAGWYKNSPTPGSVGPAIILGHIDSRQFGPGVFYNLGKLNPGDEIDVTRQDGSVAVFKVDGVRLYPKNNFPTAEVYGNIDHAGLRLITCGGTFDPSIHSYESNIVAYASLVSSH